jgi:preprotein translocase subunit YajC
MTMLTLLAANSSQSSPLGGLLLFVPLILLFYFLAIRPQRTRARQQQELMKAIEVGDEIETIGGIFGKVVRGDDDFLYLEISPGTTVKVSRGAVRRRVYEPADEGDEKTES